MPFRTLGSSEMKALEVSMETGRDPQASSANTGAFLIPAHLQVLRAQSLRVLVDSRES